MFFDEEKSEKVDNTLWTELFRPVKLDGYIGNESLKERVSDFIEKNDVPHLLLHGRAGTGKCLDYSEEIEIEMEVSADEYEILKRFEID